MATIQTVIEVELDALEEQPYDDLLTAIEEAIRNKAICTRTSDNTMRVECFAHDREMHEIISQVIMDRT